MRRLQSRMLQKPTTTLGFRQCHNARERGQGLHLGAGASAVSVYLCIWRRERMIACKERGCLQAVD